MFNKKKECYFHKNRVRKIDIMDEQVLRRFTTDSGKILPRRITGTSAKWQRRLARAIKIARNAGLIASRSS